MKPQRTQPQRGEILVENKQTKKAPSPIEAKCKPKQYFAPMGLGRVVYSNFLPIFRPAGLWVYNYASKIKDITLRK